MWYICHFGEIPLPWRFVFIYIEEEKNSNASPKGLKHALRHLYLLVFTVKSLRYGHPSEKAVKNNLK
jgi:hypothetical protein